MTERVLLLRAAMMANPVAYRRAYMRHAKIVNGIVVHNPTATYYQRLRAKHHPTATLPAPTLPPMAAPTRRPARKSRPTPDPKVWGPPKWAEFHEAIKTIRDYAVFMTWVQQWAAGLPLGCACTSKALALLAAMPPPKRHTHRRLWGWRYHNKIRADLGQKRFPRKAFDKLYPPDT